MRWRRGRGADVALAAVALLGETSGCGEGTDLNQLVSVDPVSDASAAGWVAGDGSSFQDPFGGAPPYVATMGSSSHNAGMSCIQSGCHGAAAAALPLLVGGTVYQDYQGTTPAPGIEVRIVDAAGHATSSYPGPEGNFYIMAANANGVAFPAAIGARDATAARPMVTTLTASLGSCGQTQCHIRGGGPTTGTGNYYPIHVP